MRSVVVEQFGGPEVLSVVELPEPELGPRDVRVQVAASSVNAIDLSTRAGRLAAAGLMSRPDRVGMGWDVAGEVVEVGAAVADVRVGDAVVGLRDLLVAPGAHAESVVLAGSAVTPAPRTWSAVEAATLPLNGLTALGALAAAGLDTGDTVLVTGAGGGVGGYLLELCRDRGIRTIASTRPGRGQRARELGADVVVGDEDLGQAVRAACGGGVDAVVDAAVRGVAAHEALRSGGTFVALVRPFAPPPIRGTRVVVHEVGADARRLAGLVRLADRGRLTPRVAATVPLAEAARAHELLERGGLDGRVVLVPSA
jgi:NADPH:quinone reductase-like Zn-dependent oxidoreductase